MAAVATKRIDCSGRLPFREASSKGGVFVLLWETYTFIYKVNPNKLKSRSLAGVLPLLDWHGNTWESARSERQWLHLCMFLVVVVSHLWGVCIVCVSFYSHYRQSKLCVLPRNCIFLYFLLLFFRLKFSKTPFHVVLSKNKTNTKKKISFLIINFCFFPQFTVSFLVFFCTQVWTLHAPKTNGPRVCVFVIFWVAFTFFFHSFFLDFFLYFVTKIYFLH